jgi:hypothetical protein
MLAFILVRAKGTESLPSAERTSITEIRHQPISLKLISDAMINTAKEPVAHLAAYTKRLLILSFITSVSVKVNRSEPIIIAAAWYCKDGQPWCLFEKDKVNRRSVIARC